MPNDLPMQVKLLRTYLVEEGYVVKDLEKGGFSFISDDLRNDMLNSTKKLESDLDSLRGVITRSSIDSFDSFVVIPTNNHGFPEFQIAVKTLYESAGYKEDTLIEDFFLEDFFSDVCVFKSFILGSYRRIDLSISNFIERIRVTETRKYSPLDLGIRNN